MGDEETIAAFNKHLSDIANQAYQLGKRYLDSKLVRKVLRSLLEKFVAKVVAIREAWDVDNMRLDELMRLL